VSKAPRSARAIALASAAAVFAILPAHATAPTDQYGAFNRDNVVIYDQKTQLTWERGVAPTPMNQTSAASYCATLVLDGGGGWRLPTYKELLTLVDEEAFDNDFNGAPETKAIDLAAFPANPPGYFWSSSLVVGQSGKAWAVDFSSGEGVTQNDQSFASVRCVR
jgi:hypothetical protein